MNLTGSGNIVVSWEKSQALVSQESRQSPFPSPLPTVSANPYSSLGFWSYATGSDVVVSRGYLKVTSPASGGGSWAYLDTEIAQATITGLDPGTNGYVIFAYAQEAVDAGPETRGTDFNVDFGDPGGNYFLEETAGMEATVGESNAVNGNRYGYIFSENPPSESNTLFQSIICMVSVTTAGIPTVYPVHFGELTVPLGYIGKTVNFVADRID